MRDRESNEGGGARGCADPHSCLPLRKGPTVYYPDLMTRERLEIAGMLAAQTHDILEIMDRRLEVMKAELLEAIKDNGKPD